MKATELIAHLRKKRDTRNLREMEKLGINITNAMGTPIPDLRLLAKRIGLHQEISLELWEDPLHEAKILAALLGDPKLVTERQMEEWVAGFDSWDVCDQVCGNLFDKTPFAYKKAVAWSNRKEEFVKRAGFVLMACLAVHDKKVSGAAFEKFFPIITREATDERNYVKKAVSWALRQIGKRSLTLNRKAIDVAKLIGHLNTPSAKWIASNALHDLQNEKLQKRLME